MIRAGFFCGLACGLAVLLGACERAQLRPWVPIVPAGVRSVIPVRWDLADSSLEGPVRVSISIAGKPVSEVELRGGLAEIEAGPFEPGKIEIKATRGSEVAEWPVYAVQPDRSLLVCDVDHTVDAAGSFSALLAGDADAGTEMPGARAALAELAKRFAIVYLTARDERLRTKTEAFLARAKLPPGPLLCWRLERDPVSRATLKIRRLRELRAVWPRVAWGIGDKQSDDRAYVASGLRSVILDPALDAEVLQLSERRWRARSWDAIRELIRREDATE